MNTKRKLVTITALLFVLILALGCTSTLPDKNAFDALAKLQSKYSATNALPTSTIKLNDYVTDLSLLVGKSSGSAKKVIESELYSAQTFLYLNKAIEQSNLIDYQNMRCASKEVRDVTSSIGLANDNYTKAVNALSSLSTTESKYLRDGQLQTVKSFGEQATQLQTFFDKKC